MTDKELLELAAKAAGMADAEYQDMRGWGEVRYGMSEAMHSHALWKETDQGYWNPLVDDGDALRLAVQLKMCVSVNDEHTSIDCSEGWVAIQQAHEADPAAATRRAITRAAASIGAKGDAS